jgi:hypothetical protein
VTLLALFPFCYTRGNFTWEQEIEFPIIRHWYKVCRIICWTSHRPHSIPVTFRVEFGFLVAQFYSPYLLHSSSYEFSHRTWDFHTPIFCAITVPMISLVELVACVPTPNFPNVEKSSHECLSHECGGLWPHLAF